MGSNDDLIYRLKSVLPIEAIVGEYVELKKSGRNLKGLCPFHDEKTPSFFVSPDKGFYHCFGCKASGDIIKFIEEIEHVNFIEAVQMLAEKANIDTSEYKFQARSGDSDEIIAANEDAAKFYNNELKYNREAYRYLTSRGMTKRQIDRHRIGYARSGNPLVKHIRHREGNWKQFEKAGLIMKNENTYRDRFYNRIMFPIADRMGKIIGFGGRVMEGNGPKYINSAENAVFKKGHFLYGLDMAKKSIRQSSTVIICEGYMDFIALYNAGIVNAVAQLGTACTPMQAKLLSRMAEKVILMYDADSAGIEAAKRSAPILLKEGIAVYVFEYEQSKDPDELLKAVDSIDFDYINSHSVDFITFARKYVSVDNDDSIIRKKHIIEYAANAIKGIKDMSLKAVYVEHACRELNVNKSAFLTGEDEHVGRNRRKSPEQGKAGNGIYTELLAMMLSDADIAFECCQYIDDDEYNDIGTKGLFMNICNHLAQSKQYNIDNIMNSDKIKDYNDEILEKVLKYADRKYDISRARKIIALVKRDSIIRNLNEIEMKKKRTEDREERDRLDQLSILLRKKLKKGGISNE